MLRGLPKSKVVVELRGQVNIRRYVDQVKAPVPARVGGGGWLSGTLDEAAVGQLRAHVEEMIKGERYKEPPAVPLPLQEEAAAPHASNFAKQLHRERGEQLEQLREKLHKCMEDGTFKAVLGSGRRPKELKAVRRLAVTDEQREQLEGSTFDDEGITWKVLKVQWDDSLACIIVFYYDHDSATREMVDEDELHEDHEYVEHSSLAEVLSWIGS